MRVPGFIGPSARNRSFNVDVERTINFYPEVIDGGALGKNRMVLHGTPGLSPFVQLPTSPIRDLFYMDGRCFTVAGNRFSEVFSNQTATSYGTVAQDKWPATISSNGTAGNQLFITSGGFGYIFTLTTNAFAQITDSDFPTPVVMGAYLDTYFVALKRNSRQFNISDILDGTSWNGLDLQETSWSADNLLSMAVNHRELWLLGSRVSHVWYNSGAASFPFQPIQGVLIEHGILAPFSLKQLDNTLFWLGQDATGARIVWRANGYTPERISSHAMEHALEQVADVEDAVAWTYQEEGHSFYVLYIPKAETTWTFDVATNLWHERAFWDPDNCVWTPHLGRCHAFAFDKHLVGDRANGVIYELSLDFLTDGIVTLGSASPSRSASVSPSVSPSAGPYAGVAWGESTPTGDEEPKSWTDVQTAVGGAITVDGDANYGLAEVPDGSIVYTSVVDTGDDTTKTFTLQRDKYETGTGTVTLSIRGSLTLFGRYDLLPAWQEYTVAVTAAWRYVQVRVEYS